MSAVYFCGFRKYVSWPCCARLWLFWSFQPSYQLQLWFLYISAYYGCQVEPYFLAIWECQPITLVPQAQLFLIPAFSGFLTVDSWFTRIFAPVIPQRPQLLLFWKRSSVNFSWIQALGMTAYSPLFHQERLRPGVSSLAWTASLFYSSAHWFCPWMLTSSFSCSSYSTCSLAQTMSHHSVFLCPLLSHCFYHLRSFLLVCSQCFCPPIAIVHFVVFYFSEPLEEVGKD